MYEAVQWQKPVIILPLIGDQGYNGMLARPRPAVLPLLLSTCALHDLGGPGAPPAQDCSPGRRSSTMAWVSTFPPPGWQSTAGPQLLQAAIQRVLTEPGFQVQALAPACPPCRAGTTALQAMAWSAACTAGSAPRHHG